MIIRLRKRLGLGESAENLEEYMRTVFAHISNIIRITNVAHQAPAAASAMFGGPVGAEYIELNVTYELQPLVEEGFDVAQAIREAVGLRGDLDLLQVEQPPVVVRLPAIVQVEGLAGVNTYRINPIFARFIATHPDYLQQLREQNVQEVRLIFHRIPGGNLLQYTGQIETIRQGAVDQDSPYRRIAGIVTNDPALRTRFATREITGIELRVTPGAGAGLTITEPAEHGAEMPAPTLSGRKF